MVSSVRLPVPPRSGGSGPVGTDFEEILEDGLALLGVGYLGMPLDAVEVPVGVAHGLDTADVALCSADDADPLVGSLSPDTRVWASHADEVTDLPAGFVRTAESDICGIEAMSDTDRDLYGVQWHPEVAHTEEGEAVFENFLEICADKA